MKRRSTRKKAKANPRILLPSGRILKQRFRSKHSAAKFLEERAFDLQHGVKPPLARRGRRTYQQAGAFLGNIGMVLPPVRHRRPAGAAPAVARSSASRSYVDDDLDIAVTILG